MSQSTQQAAMGTALDSYVAEAKAGSGVTAAESALDVAVAAWIASSKAGVGTSAAQIAFDLALAAREDALVSASGNREDAAYLLTVTACDDAMTDLINAYKADATASEDTDYAAAYAAAVAANKAEGEDAATLRAALVTSVNAYVAGDVADAAVTVEEKFTHAGDANAAYHAGANAVRLAQKALSWSEA